MAFLFEDDKSKKDLSEALAPTLTELENSYKANIATIANAITSQGVATAATATPEQMATNIRAILNQTYTKTKTYYLAAVDDTYGPPTTYLDMANVTNLTIKNKGSGPLFVTGGVTGTGVTIASGASRSWAVSSNRGDVLLESASGTVTVTVTTTNRYKPY